MEENLIDSELNETPKDVILGIIRWWEKKRLLFNLFILGVIVLTVAPYLLKHPNSSEYILRLSFFVQPFLFFLFINSCYCAGWGIQLLGYYYFKIQYDSKVLDYILFIIGCLFTGFVTYVGYDGFLIY